MFKLIISIYEGRPPVSRLILKTTILVAISACISSCIVAPLEQSITMTQTIDADRAAILSNGKRWITYYQAGEIEKMRDLYEEDTWVMPNGSPQLKGVDETLAFFARNRRSDNEVTLRSELEDLVIEGDRAYLITQYSMRIKSPTGGLTDIRGRTLLVYRKGVDGMWRVWRDMDNSAPDVEWRLSD